MGFFTTRERAELGESAEPEAEGKVREFVSRDYAPRRRPPDGDFGFVGKSAEPEVEGKGREFVRRALRPRPPDSDLGFVTTRERAEPGKSAEPEVKRKAREFVRRDYAPRRGPPDSDLVAGNVGGLLKQVMETSLTEIDALIADLQSQREKLLGESARVQRTIMEYAKLSQSTMQSTRIITESMTFWNKVPDDPGTAESPAEGISKPEGRGSAAEALTQHTGVTQHSDDNATSVAWEKSRGSSAQEAPPLTPNTHDTQ